jgi:hypothetical protein
MHLYKVIAKNVLNWDFYCLSPNPKWWSGHWVKIIFFRFPYFLKAYNNPQGYAFWKRKKVKNQPTLLHSIRTFS